MKETIFLAEFSEDEDGGVAILNLDTQSGNLSRVRRLPLPWLNSLAITRQGKLGGTLRYLHGGSGIGGTVVFDGHTLTTVSSEGEIPCHCAWDPSGTHLAVCNYISGSFSVRNMQDGRIQTIRHAGRGITPRQMSPHPHHAFYMPDGKHLVVTDLGMDALLVYDLDEAGNVATGTSKTILLPAGFGPRQTVLNKRGCALTVGELAPGAALLDMKQGKLLSVLSFPKEMPDTTGAAIALHPDGETAAISLRGANRIELIRSSGMELVSLGSFSCSGKKPMSLLWSGDGETLVCANEESGNVCAFRETGTSFSKVSEIPAHRPMCLIRE